MKQRLNENFPLKLESKSLSCSAVSSMNCFNNHSFKCGKFEEENLQLQIRTLRLPDAR